MNLAASLKTEIARVAKKTLKQDVGSLRLASVQQRKQIAALKGQLAELQRLVARLQKSQPRAPSPADAGDAEARVRFSAKGLKSHRAKLGLSAEDYARLIGASALSIYRWESGKGDPRRPQVVALAAVRGLGKRAALARLAELDGAT